MDILLWWNLYIQRCHKTQEDLFKLLSSSHHLHYGCSPCEEEYYLVGFAYRKEEASYPCGMWDIIDFELRTGLGMTFEYLFILLYACFSNVKCVFSTKKKIHHFHEILN